MVDVSLNTSAAAVENAVPYLLLPPPPADVSDLPALVVHSPLSGFPSQTRLIEAAGPGFENYILSHKQDLFCIATEKDQNSTEKGDDSNDTNDQEDLNKLRLMAHDYYELMGLGDKRWKATDKDLKLAYKKMVIKYHPDKNPGSDDELFKAFQKAWEVLSDPAKRRGYDSKELFDDSYPKSVPDGASFYETFGPVFDRNSKWSTTRAVPELGDENTRYEEVEKFYTFWLNFQSWREFSYLDEHNLDDADGRDEKRWMQRENAKKREKARKQENIRILRMTETAQKLDPRVREYNKKAQEERERQAQARYEEQRKKKENAERKRLAAQKKRTAAAEAKAKEEREKKASDARLKRELEKQRSEFRKMCIDEKLIIQGRHVEMICLRNQTEELAKLCDYFKQGDREAGVAAIDAHVAVFNEEEEQAKNKNRQEETGKQVKWSQHELRLLSQAIVKFPPGVARRWNRIADMLPGKSVKDVQKKTQEVKDTKKAVPPKATFVAPTKAKGADVPSSVNYARVQAAASGSSATPDAATAEGGTRKGVDTWTKEEQKQLEAGLRKFPTSLGKERWDRIAECVPTRTKKGCILRFKYLVEKTKARQAKAATTAAATPADKQ